MELKYYQKYLRDFNQHGYWTGTIGFKFEKDPHTCNYRLIAIHPKHINLYSRGEKIEIGIYYSEGRITHFIKLNKVVFENAEEAFIKGEHIGLEVEKIPRDLSLPAIVYIGGTVSALGHYVIRIVKYVGGTEPKPVNPPPAEIYFGPQYKPDSIYYEPIPMKIKILDHSVSESEIYRVKETDLSKDTSIFFNFRIIPYQKRLTREKTPYPLPNGKGWYLNLRFDETFIGMGQRMGTDFHIPTEIITEEAEPVVVKVIPIKKLYLIYRYV